MPVQTMPRDKEVYESSDAPRFDIPSHGSTSLSGNTRAPAKYNDLPITFFKRSKHASIVAFLGNAPWYSFRY